ncbi:unnamed protein product [Effrenium voratum]|nr:unnamed protein product [Effrenium voratum]
MTWRDRATNSAGRWAPPSVQKATDFDTILQEGLQALAKRVQEHHDYLVKVQPGQGRESWRNDRSSGHSHEQDTGLPPPLPLCASVSRSSKVSYCAPDADSDRSNPQQVQLDGRPEQGSSGLKPAPLPLRIPGIVSHEEPPEVAMNGYSDLEGADEEQEAEPVVVKHTFKLHEGWRSVQASAPHLKEAQAAVASAWFQVDATESDDEGSDSESSDSEVSQNPALAERCGRRFQTCLEPWMISPNSVFRSCWDSLACLFVVYECVMIPLAFFDFGESAVLDVIGWVVRLFWSMDFPLSCLTGYALAGDMLEMRPSKVLPHYAKTWMSLDVSMLAVDWAEVAIGGVGSLNAARMGKTVKSLRMIRMMRLWRLLNVSQMPEFVRVLIHHYFQSEVSRILLDIFKILVFLVWINHVLACCWYGVADSLEASDHSWIREARFQSSMIIHLYVTCFHWSLTQFAGSTDVFPSNVYERTFAVFALLFCFILSASIVSSITTSMTRLSIARSKETTKLTALKEYLRENHISSRTALRVQRNAQYAIEEQKRHTPEEDIELLGYLSEPLRVELRFEITMPVLRKHAFFNVLEQERIPPLRGSFATRH